MVCPNNPRWGRHRSAGKALNLTPLSVQLVNGPIPAYLGVLFMALPVRKQWPSWWGAGEARGCPVYQLHAKPFYEEGECPGVGRQEGKAPNPRKMITGQALVSFQPLTLLRDRPRDAASSCLLLSWMAE